MIYGSYSSLRLNGEPVLLESASQVVKVQYLNGEINSYQLVMQGQVSKEVLVFPTSTSLKFDTSKS